MSDIRLEELPFEFDGKVFMLRCNMNVLADVQEEFGGVISDALSGRKPTRSVLAFLAAMLNDYADEMGWEKRYSTRELGRRLSPGAVPLSAIMGLVTRAVTPAGAVSAEDTGENQDRPESSGN